MEEYYVVVDGWVGWGVDFVDVELLVVGEDGVL